MAHKHETKVECYQQVELLLKNKQMKELISLFKNDDFQAEYFNDARVALMSIIINIYEMECADRVSRKILDNAENIEQLETFYLKTKFMVWRIEFYYLKEEKEEFAKFIRKYHISLPFLKYIIHTSSFDKANTSFKIAMIFKENKMFSQAFGMFNYTNELSPEEEVVFCEMADICFSDNQYANAASCIGMIKNPTKLLEDYQKKWGM